MITIKLYYFLVFLLIPIGIFLWKRRRKAVGIPVEAIQVVEEEKQKEKPQPKARPLRIVAKSSDSKNPKKGIDFKDIEKEYIRKLIQEDIKRVEKKEKFLRELLRKL
ncbi:MAG: hypothetical protein B6U95_09100 [Thermofilum sp. ex4484_82]|nr:MAG: hypothetical protein B6U95_09100 [Thermofilum sp. ex4484_82]OYT36005.1 MAG: hypothetical protein B6U96_09105 [Archaeoglobales archaeon ex4484_92]